MTWHVAMRPGKRKALQGTAEGDLVRHRKTRDRGLANLVMARRWLLDAGTQGAS